MSDLSLMGYVDSGVLIKIYIRERNTEAAVSAVTRFPSVPFTPLHELEMQNTLHALEGRGVIDSRQRVIAERHLDTDIAEGRLARVVPDWNLVYQLALELSARHTGRTLARSLDVLHVAIARSLAHPDRRSRDEPPTTAPFVTGDRRQAAVAESCGFSVTFID